MTRAHSGFSAKITRAPGFPAAIPAARPKLFLFPLLAAALAALAAQAASPPPAAAQGLARKGAVNFEDVFNPKPDQLDLGLPMPCGMYMAFRVVGFNFDGKITDMRLRFGSDDQGDNGFYHRRRVIHLGSALSIDHLPAEWRQAVEAALMGSRGDQLFLIGKYEVTAGQWDAVMKGECGPLNSDSARPKTEVSWYDVIDFTATYMEWLLANSPMSLPAYGSDRLAMGALRLPTEDEWEYAAMGGHFTTENIVGSGSNFVMEQGKVISDYGLIRDDRNPESRPGAIGRFLPNPLGLYDTIGNVAEMTISSFKMSVGNRLHGSAGGFVSKGGSFNSQIDDVYPGKRLEIPFFRSDGPSMAGNLGFRLAISAPNTMGEDRVISLMGELAEILPPPLVSADEAGASKAGEPAGILPSAPGVLSDTAGMAPPEPPKTVPVNVQGLDLFQKVDALVQATSDPELKAGYLAIRGDLGDFRLSEAWQNESAVRDNCRALIYVVYTTRNFYDRYRAMVANNQRFEEDINNIKGLLDSGDLDARAKKELREEIGAYEAQLAESVGESAQYEQTLNYQYSYYLSLMQGLLGYDQASPGAVDSSMARLGLDIKGDDLYANDMRGAHQRVSQDIAAARAGNGAAITFETLLGFN